MSVASALRAQARRIVGIARLRPFDTASAAGRSQERYRRILLATSSALGTRVIGTIASFVTVPMLLSYLGKEQFGLWSTVISLVAWLGLLDLGISNGLINAVSEAYGKDDRRAAARYVTTAAATLAAISAVSALLLAIFSSKVEWGGALGVSDEASHNLLVSAVAAGASIMLIGMPLAVVQSTYAGHQMLYVANVFTSAGSLATVLVVWTSIRRGVDLPVLILAVGAATVAVNIVSLFFLTQVQMPWLKPRLSDVSWGALRRLLRTTVPLFLFQIGALAVNQSQLIILARAGSLVTVAEYAVLLNVIRIASGLVSLTTSSFVPSYREAVERGDSTWVSLSFRRMLLVRMTLASISAVGVVEFGDKLIRVWLRRADIQFGLDVWIGVAVFLLAVSWVTSYSDLLTILDRIWVQVGLVFINGLLTVGLTLWLAPRYAVLGALVALGFTTVVGWTWVFPLISRPALNKAR
jgi:O-antigen/teichoic acid export membrane protein